MSYDVTFGYSGPEYPEDVWRNYTSNVSRMWQDAIGESLGDLIDKFGDHNAALIPLLERGVQRMESDAEHFRAMNPENGWGDYDGALAYLRWMLAMCHAVPEGNVRVWR